MDNPAIAADNDAWRCPPSLEGRRCTAMGRKGSMDVLLVGIRRRISSMAAGGSGFLKPLLGIGFTIISFI